MEVELLLREDHRVSVDRIALDSRQRLIRLVESKRRDLGLVLGNTRGA